MDIRVPSKATNPELEAMARALAECHYDASFGLEGGSPAGYAEVAWPAFVDAAMCARAAMLEVHAKPHGEA